MNWNEIRKFYSNQWIIIEALEAHTTSESCRKLDRMAIIESCPDGKTAMQRYRNLHKKFPYREFYFVHTSREELDIREQQWIGVRRGNAVTA